jgi:hypothetical protein
MAKNIDRNARVIVLSPAEHAALVSFLYEFQDEDKLRAIAREHGFGMGANHIEDVTKMWRKLALTEDVTA